MKSNNQGPKWERERLSPRIHTVKEISVRYEGHTEEIAIRPPDVSAQGMFFNTATIFPEGAVLNLRFRLALSGAEIRTRCEVRYCLPGVGVGVEFIGISPEAIRHIEREVKLCRWPHRRRKLLKVG
jgi:PilZ domain-containing protein